MTLFPSRIARFVALGSIPLLAGCAGTSPPVRRAPSGSAPDVQLANPASRHCIEMGATLVIERNPAGDQYGVCIKVMQECKYLSACEILPPVTRSEA